MTTTAELDRQKRWYAAVHTDNLTRRTEAVIRLADEEQAELRREVEALREWRKRILDEGFGYDDSEESAAEVLEWAPTWRALGDAAQDRARDAEVQVAKVRDLAAWFEAQPNWNEWGVHRQIREALA